MRTEYLGGEVIYLLAALNASNKLAEENRRDMDPVVLRLLLDELRRGEFLRMRVVVSSETNTLSSRSSGPNWN